jgi:hypothetical protein
MGKTLIFLKACIFLASLYFIFTKIDFSEREYLLHGYTDQQSYFPGEIVTAYLQPSSPFPRAYIKLTNVLGEKKDVVTANLPENSITNEYPWRDGFGYSPSFKYAIPSDLKSGIYLWEDKVPFTVKSKEPADIVVVYPFNSINLTSNVGGKSFFEHISTENKGSDTLSFLRPYNKGIHYLTSSFLEWLIKQEYRVNYIADSDMEDSAYLANSKIIVIIGSSHCWTRNAKDNFDNFIAKGGNALILSANTMYWHSRISQDKKQLITYNDCRKDPYADDPSGPWYQKKEGLFRSLGSSIIYGGYPQRDTLSFKGFKIYNGSSPLFANTGLQNNDLLRLNNTIVDGIGAKVDFQANTIEISDVFYNKWHEKEILAIERVKSAYYKENIGAFLVLRKSPTSGYIINTGSSDWCSAEGIGGPDSTIVRQITKNAIELLLNNQSPFKKAIRLNPGSQ